MQSLTWHLMTRWFPPSDGFVPVNGRQPPSAATRFRRLFHTLTRSGNATRQSIRDAASLRCVGLVANRSGVPLGPEIPRFRQLPNSWGLRLPSWHPKRKAWAAILAAGNVPWGLAPRFCSSVISRLRLDPFSSTRLGTKWWKMPIIHLTCICIAHVNITTRISHVIRASPTVKQECYDLPLSGGVFAILPSSSLVVAKQISLCVSHDFAPCACLFWVPQTRSCSLCITARNVSNFSWHRFLIPTLTMKYNTGLYTRGSLRLTMLSITIFFCFEVGTPHYSRKGRK